MYSALCIVHAHAQQQHATVGFKRFNMYKRPDVVSSLTAAAATTAVAVTAKEKGKEKKNTKNSENKLSNAPSATTTVIFFILFLGCAPRARSHSIYFVKIARPARITRVIIYAQTHETRTA